MVSGLTSVSEHTGWQCVLKTVTTLPSPLPSSLYSTQVGAVQTVRGWVNVSGFSWTFLRCSFCRSLSPPNLVVDNSCILSAYNAMLILMSVDISAIGLVSSEISSRAPFKLIVLFTSCGGLELKYFTRRKASFLECCQLRRKSSSLSMKTLFLKAARYESSQSQNNKWYGR